MKLCCGLYQEKQKAGQVILEFTFCFIIVLLMIYGVAKVFFWTGKDLSSRQRAHDSVLLSGATPLQQIRANFYVPERMNAIWQAGP